eukprot:TRINITY_DN3328_c2_g4_i1.p1 TRINITY_DN3328_c2_g4~~TRINITY_DN3328_c2_g4_i1.p1  ORF type:complete len:195 (-),score=40.18 TRINITY_DN3328_c2_g4_i1:108-692(-)
MSTLSNHLSLFNIEYNVDIELSLGQKIFIEDIITNCSYPPTQSTYLQQQKIVSIINWVIMISSRMDVHDSTLLTALILLKRICNQHELKLNYLNVFQLSLTSILVSSKLLEDINFLNREWVYCCENRFDLQTINQMENEFLDLLNFNLIVKPIEISNLIENRLYGGSDTQYCCFNDCNERCLKCEPVLTDATLC